MINTFTHEELKFLEAGLQNSIATTHFCINHSQGKPEMINQFNRSLKKIEMLYHKIIKLNSGQFTTIEIIH